MSAGSNKLSLEALKLQYLGQSSHNLIVNDVVRENGKWFFVCRCICGNIVNVRKNHFEHGSVKSCGCLGKCRESRVPQDVKPGNRFGLLTVQSIQQHYRSSTGRKDGKEAICLCDCSNQKTVTLSQLRTGKVKSCGCLQKQTRSNNGYKNINRALASLSSHPEIRQETCRKVGKKTGPENIKYALFYLSSHPEILKENGRKNLKHAHAYLESRPEILQEIGCQNIKHANAYLSSHPEIRQQNGRLNVEYANAYLDSHPGIRQENGRKTGSENIKHAHTYLQSHPEILQQNVKYAIDAQRRDPNSVSLLQKEYRLFLEQNNIPYETEFLLENHYFDFKVNDFLIEINGDVYHSSKYENIQNPSANGPSTKYLDPTYHKSLLDLAISHGYRLIQLWEHSSSIFNKRLLLSQLLGEANIEDYVEYISNHKVICNDYGFNIQGSYLPDSGKWISTGYNEIVTESYPKGKVLVYNSGYTVLE